MQDYKKKSVVLVQGALSEGAVKDFKAAKTDAVFTCEGRPTLEAGKTNTKALLRKGITPTVICDNMAGFLFQKDLVKEVYMACQYVDNAGALCDTGALICAVLAQKHKIPVRLVEGKTRTRFLGNPQDILTFEGHAIAPKGSRGYVPLVEWVPGKYLK